MAIDPSDPLVAMTPHRQTRVELGGPRWIVYTQPWSDTRLADQFRLSGIEGASNQADSSGVFHLPGVGWILEPTLLSLVNGTKTANSFQIYDGNENANLAANVQPYYRWRKATDTGAAYPEGTADQALPAYESRVASGNPFAPGVSADEVSFPGPPDGEFLPRALAGVKTERANQGFLFSFYVPQVGDSGAELYRFLWGGPADIVYRKKRAGEWCLSFCGDGRMKLWARVDAEWQRQGEFFWSDQVSGRSGWNHCLILPYGRTKLFFVTQSGSGSRGGGGRPGAAKLPGRTDALNISVHRHVGSLAGYSFKETIAGPGVVRVDCRADLACRFAVGASGYATSGQIIDAPFALPRVVPAGSILRAKVRADKPTGTSATIGLFDADTGDALEAGPDLGSFLTTAGQRRYHAGIFLGGDNAHSPVIKDRTIELDISVSEARQEEDPLVQPTVGPVSVDILGQDMDPTHWSGVLEIHDQLDEYTPLRKRGRVPIRIYTQFAPATPPLVFETCIFEGEATAEHEEVYLAAPGNPHYPRYSVRMLGEWGRVARQRSVMRATRYGWDDDTGQPRTVTATIRELLQKAGVQDDDIDVPEQPLRFFISTEEEGAPYQLAQDIAFLDVAVKLARDYLDGWIVYDPNAGAHGMWRLRLNPERPETNILWNFVTTAPEVLGNNGLPVAAVQHVFDSYPAKTSFCRVLKTKRQPPEFNSVTVEGMTPGPTHQVQLLAHEHNSNSFTADPATPTADPDSLDYFDGQEVRQGFFDYGIQTQEGANWLARRYLQLGGRGRELKLIEAPFYPVTDLQDTQQTRPRPLMTGDAVTLDTEFGVVRNTSLFWTDDVQQWQRVEVAMVRLEGNLES